jgi:hypothetical protein
MVRLASLVIFQQLSAPTRSLCPAGLAPYYEHICGELGWDVKQDKLQEMQASNAKQLEELAAKIKVCAHACH